MYQNAIAALSGVGNPNNSVFGYPFQTYQDSSNGDIWSRGDVAPSATGWTLKFSPSNIVTSGSVEVGSDLSVNRDAIISGNLSANGDTTLSNTQIGGTLSAAGDITLQGVLAIFSGANDGDVLKFNAGAWTPQAP